MNISFIKAVGYMKNKKMEILNLVRLDQVIVHLLNRSFSWLLNID